MTPWWDESATTIVIVVGAGLGATAGILGAASGTLAPRGIGRGPVVTLHSLYVLTGLVSLAAGIVAVVSGQPYRVYYPLLLIGFILSVVMTPLLPILLIRYRQAEHRRLEAEEIRRS